VGETGGHRSNLSSGPLRIGLLRIPPPLVYIVVFLVGVGIDTVIPIPRMSSELERSCALMGATVLALGVLLGPANALMFLFRGTTLNPVGSPTRLFTGGVYRISRNPMYLGLLMIYAGVALLQWQLWALLLILVPFFVVDRIYIPAEERRMLEVFGEQYERYCKRVMRWLGTTSENSRR
jgi:protein-S-isoprenylcysteine O-methyltransferase Ste14